MNRDPLDLLLSNAQKVIDPESLGRKLASGKKLHIKLGVDPTRADLTFGHMVVFNKLRQFQDLGHEAIFLIGDFTTTIGDPSGRSETRPMLTADEIQRNAKTYLDQAFRILDPTRTVVRYNSEWYSKMGLADLLVLARQSTVAQLIEREDFAQRYSKGIPISLVEFLYPLIQGYDSVMLAADVELGGTDQLFNMLVGRDLQRAYGQEEQVVMCMPLIVGLDGKRKMSKSFDNYIAFNDNADQMFGKIMSIPDEIMASYRALLLCQTPNEVARLSGQHPMANKLQLAGELVQRFHGQEAATRAKRNFDRIFSLRGTPDEMPEIRLADLGNASEMTIIDVLWSTQNFSSKKEIRRLLGQGAIRIDGQQVVEEIKLSAGTGQIVQVGKRQFFRII